MKKLLDTIDDYVDFFSPMISALGEHLDLHMVVLFGSRARGDHATHSDFDVVIVGDFQGTFLSRLEWISRYLPEVPMDVFCYTVDEFEALFADFNVTAIDAIGEGIVLFGKNLFAAYKARHEEFTRRGMKKGNFALHLPS